jgi:hypothetical protein
MEDQEISRVKAELRKAPSKEHIAEARRLNIMRMDAVRYEKLKVVDMRNALIKEGKAAKISKRNFIKSVAELSIIEAPIRKKIALLSKPISAGSIQILDTLKSREDLDSYEWMEDDSNASMRKLTAAEDTMDTAVLSMTSLARKEYVKTIRDSMNTQSNPADRALAGQMAAYALSKVETGLLQTESTLYSNSESAQRLEETIRKSAGEAARMLKDPKNSKEFFAGMAQSNDLLTRDGDGPAFAYRVGMDFTEASLKDTAVLASEIMSKGGNMSPTLMDAYLAESVTEILDASGGTNKLPGFKKEFMKGVAQELALDPVIGKDKKRLNSILGDIAKGVFAKKTTSEKLDGLSDEELAAKGMIRIPGYTKKDGTKVKHHYRKIDPVKKGLVK